ncbi:hypothetical protein G9272_16780 [Streptomyces asoensis]|uniref:Uncharacterized protein n=1 Tax=Streptomyces asoensis TaxID=249586 RepID=A0A6M4WPH2_9ACTN|nr:hypothetical protein [Streptomyces asoensis]QJT01762.1 hypothetical protein G9272_16780 [Streptomyces asoensis]
MGVELEVPQVHVYAADLGGRSPAALKDSRTEFRLAIDFSRPPDEVAASLTQLFQESVDTRRWTRRQGPDDDGEAGH